MSRLAAGRLCPAGCTALGVSHFTAPTRVACAHTAGRATARAASRSGISSVTPRVGPSTLASLLVTWLFQKGPSAHPSETNRELPTYGRCSLKNRNEEVKNHRTPFSSTTTTTTTTTIINTFVRRKVLASKRNWGRTVTAQHNSFPGGSCAEVCFPVGDTHRGSRNAYFQRPMFVHCGGISGGLRRKALREPWLLQTSVAERLWKGASA